MLVSKLPTRGRVDGAVRCVTDLVFGTEDVRVILDETSHSGQSTERTGRLISVENAELGHADRQLSVVTGSGAENESVSRAVHRLERPDILLDLKGEHVFVVICETKEKKCVS